MSFGFSNSTYKWDIIVFIFFCLASIIWHNVLQNPSMSSQTAGFPSFYGWIIFCFPGGSSGKESTCNAGDPGSIHGKGRSPAEGNGNPLQYFCLEKSTDRGAWRATVHGVAKNRINTMQVVYPLICPWTLSLFPCFGCCIIDIAAINRECISNHSWYLT